MSESICDLDGREGVCTDEQTVASSDSQATTRVEYRYKRCFYSIVNRLDR
jgi:hypothetical protein